MPSSTKFLQSACEYFRLPYDFIDPYHMVMRIYFGDQYHVIINQSLGLNSDSEQRLMKDKYYLYLLLSPHIPMPSTYRYVDPDPSGKYVKFAQFSSHSEIASNIESVLDYPIVVKRNSGSLGKNVFICHSSQEIHKALESIYSKNQLEYDHVALAEHYVAPRMEYRIIVLHGKVELIYQKRGKQAGLPKNLIRYPILNHDLLKKVQALVHEVYQLFPVVYAGLDIIEDDLGKLWLIEINGDPSYTAYCRHSNQINPIYTLHKKILLHLAEKYSFPLTPLEKSVDYPIDYSHQEITMS